MSYYELTRLQTVIFGAGKAAPGIEAWLGHADASGKLLGAWGTDIGPLNEIFLLRSFDSLVDMMAERERMHRSDNPFGCVEHLTRMSAESYCGLDFLGPVETGSFGPYYEIRTYHMKLNGLMPTMQKWQAAIPKRLEYSPMTVAMYALDGAPRLTQIWPYPDLEARKKARGQSVTDGNWPPKGGPDWLREDMTSTIAMPLPFSPLQ